MGRDAVLDSVQAVSTISKICPRYFGVVFEYGLGKVLQSIGDMIQMIGCRYRVCQYTEHGHCESSTSESSRRFEIDLPTY